MVRLISGLIGTLAVVSLLALVSPALTPSSVGANSDPVYQQLRSIGLDGEVVSVSNFELQRDAATFHLTSGTICFVAPVNGKVTGAVFVGDGDLVLNPPIPGEQAMLKLLSNSTEFHEHFEHLVLRFTDSTYAEIQKASKPTTGACDAGLLRDSQNAMRHDRQLKYNLDGRILQDVLSSEPGGLFVAFVHGKNYDDREIFLIDPHGAAELERSVYPEEVEFLTYDENKFGIWAAFHYSAEYKNNTALSSQQNSVIQIEHQQLETTIEKSAELTGKATTTFASRVNGLRVVPFDLFQKLRVQSVTGEGGKPLSFIQEDKNDDATFFVILPSAAQSGEKYTITTTYSGKEAVINEGSGNYYPAIRESWYPNSVDRALGEYTSYDMTFRIPKGMRMAATGTLVSESNDGGQNVTVWKSEVPLTVAGFNFGRFKVEEAKLTNPPYLVQAYANEEPPDEVKAFVARAGGIIPTGGLIQGEMQPQIATGNMSTTPLLKKALAEAQISVGLYSDYFGPAPFRRLAVTQQTACNYGQSWPGLVWLPMCYLWDTTIRQQLGIQFHDYGYWKSVAPHEVAHQWWGHEVGFNSYRDQWMSEGFADMSASLYIQLVEKNPKKYIEFWNDERILLLERNNMGFRAIDAGPLTDGYRLSNSREGFEITRRLIYPKGAYVLHMIRMMMYDRQTGDKNFKETMHDFATTYSGRAATTEDFKAVVEKHLTPEMQRIGGGKMDWFFDEYVYGTALPSYAIDSSFGKNPDGDIVLSFKVTQSNVSDSFRMLVPMYMELADGHVVSLGRATIIGNSSLDGKIPLKGMKDMPHRAMLNYYNDVLSSPN
jgi:hypothetical protein